MEREQAEQQQRQLACDADHIGFFFPFEKLYNIDKLHFFSSLKYTNQTAHFDNFIKSVVVIKVCLL